MTNRTCRELAGFDPDIRHRTNDSVTCLAVVAHGQSVALLPELVVPEARPGIAVRAIAEGSVHRTIFTATRAADAERPSVQALLAAVRTAAANLGWPGVGVRTDWPRSRSPTSECGVSVASVRIARSNHECWPQGQVDLTLLLRARSTKWLR